jgi:TolB-like protein/tetratricopeptide (TPR) repeat protein
MIARFLSELRRRKVIASLVAYSVGAYALLGAVDLAAPALTLPDWSTSLVLVSAIALVPVVAFLSWFFQLGESGFERIARADDEAVPQPLSPLHWVGLAIIAAAGVGSGVLAFDEIRARQERLADGTRIAAPEDKSLAVMVFRDLSPEKDLGYLAEGLAEELSTALGRTPGLQVAAVSSSRRFSERSDGPAEVGAALGVASLLEGSVRLEGSRLLVTANLIDVASGKTRWSERFERPLDDIFGVQEEIARAILNQVMDRYVVPEGQKIAGQATSADAYVMYLQGREAFRQRTPESMREARRYFEQSAGLDPEYAPAYVGIADSVRMQSRDLETLGDLEPAIAAELASRNVDRALLRDPTLPSAYAALGNVAFMGGRKEEALAAYDKAIELNPSYADAYLWRFIALRDLARVADALASLERAKTLDPLSPVILKNWGTELSRRGRVPEALAVFDQIIELDPQSPVGYRAAAQVAYSSGDLSRSAGYYHEALKRSPQTEQYKVALADIFMTVGLHEAAGKLIDRDDYAVNLLIAADDHAGALESIRFSLAADPDDALMVFEAAWYEMLWGDREHGRALLRSVDETILAAGWFDRNYCSPQIEMAYAFPPGPDRARWLEVCRVYVQEQVANGYANAELSYMMARVAALEGNPVAARENFTAAVAAGWLQPWTANDPLLSDIMAEADVQQALQAVTGELSRQQAVLAVQAERWGYL